MAVLTDPEIQIDIDRGYLFVRKEKRTSVLPNESHHINCASELGLKEKERPDDAGSVLRDGSGLIWYGHSTYYRQFEPPIPSPQQREDTLKFGREQFPSFQHRTL